MQIIDVEQRSQKWHELRQGKITGTTLGAILGTPKAKRKAYYDVLAERLSIEANAEENPMMRGARLEEEAIAVFEEVTGKKVQVVGLTVSEENPFIASSPDGLIYNPDLEVYDEAVELKCLSSGRHIEAWLEANIPEEYDPQVLQYFIVNENLQKLYFLFYDPRITIKPMFWIVVKREDIAELIEVTKQKEIDFISSVDNKVKELLCQYEKHSSSSKNILEITNHSETSPS